MMDEALVSDEAMEAWFKETNARIDEEYERRRELEPENKMLLLSIWEKHFHRDGEMDWDE